MVWKANELERNQYEEENMAGFQFVCSLKINDTISVTKYTSTNTGLTVVIADVDKPTVTGYFCLATKVNTEDDYLLSALQDLVFQGSEKYPWKRVLDRVANRCLASGIRSRSTADYTIYTMTTAGCDGFMSLLPIYMEHIFYPTLTRASYLTEVHHITGEGKDSGVLYEAIRKYENDSVSLTIGHSMRAIYPGKYGHIASDILKKLRESGDIMKVRNYHRENYRPGNMTIIITGQVKDSDIFKALHLVEAKLISKRNRGPFTRPCQEPLSPLTESAVRDVCFPCENDDDGLSYVGWRGPSTVNEVYDQLGCSVLLEYLTENPTSPVQREFKTDEPDCTISIGCFVRAYAESMLCISFIYRPFKKLPTLSERLLKVLKGVYENGIDMKTMKSVIIKHSQQFLENLEDIPADVICQAVMRHAIYGNTNEDLERRLNPLKDLEKLAEEPEFYWLSILKRYLIDKPMIVVNGIPSKTKQKEVIETEKKRVTEQIAKLGKEGLEQKARELREAKKLNATIIPDHILSAVPISSTESINIQQIKSYTTATPEQHPKFDVTKLPLYTYLDDINTKFINITIAMDTSSVDSEARQYLPLVMRALTESPVQRDGKLIPYETIAAELQEDTAHVGTWLDLSAKLTLKLELSKYAKGIQWIHELLHGAKFTVDRIRTIATNLINEDTELKRGRCSPMYYLMDDLLYKKDSDRYIFGFMRCIDFHSKTLERLNTEAGQKEVILEMEAVRKTLTMKKNMILSLAVNIDKLAAEVSDVYAPWKLLKSLESGDKTRFRWIHKSELMNRPEDIPIRGYIVGRDCTNSASLLQCTRFIDDLDHPDVAPLTVCLRYFILTEGPLKKHMHGPDLNCSLTMLQFDSSLLYLSIENARNVVEAYKEIKASIESQINDNKWDYHLYESAKTSVIFEKIEELYKADHSLNAYFNNISPDYNQQLVQRINAVSIDDLNRVATKYLRALVDPRQCVTVIMCSPTKTGEIADAFKLMNHDLKVFESLEKCHSDNR